MPSQSGQHLVRAEPRGSDTMLPVPPAIDTEAASAHPPTVFRLGIREALQGALARAVIVQTQQLDLQQQRDQTEQASHEFCRRLSCRANLSAIALPS